MKTKWWADTGWGLSIRPVKVERETEKCWIGIDQYDRHPRRHQKEARDGRLCATWHAAHAAVMDAASKNVDRAQQRLEQAEAALTRVMYERKPREES